MEKLGLNQIREEYLKFFESKGHLRMKSFSLVPNNDPSLLLINAGMAPLKKFFTGEEEPPRHRVTTCQKCIRTPDIENVGKTARHGTFFEMLGNFSFGDYFKNEATAWAWEFVTEVMKMPVDKLWVTIYEDDDEAFEIWTKKVGVAPDRIVRMGKEDNFWEIGQGPCGPCSEIYFDRGEEHGCGKPDCKVGCDCDRYVEFWNLVFTQFDKDENGVYNRLAKPNIDTGMGLERIAAIMQGVKTLFEVDTVRRVLDEVCKISGKEYGKDNNTDISIRVVTDHIRSTTFMISDGVLPSNEGRGYVLRRLLRRAARHGRLLGIEGKFLNELCDVVIEESKSAYNELETKRDFIKSVIKSEEEKFNETLEQGLVILNQLVEKMDKGSVFSGENAFKLYDTYGFPLDLTVEILSEQGIEVDKDGFAVLMNEQREKARAGRGDDDSLGWDENIYSKLDKDLKTEFVGYETLNTEGTIKAIVAENEIVNETTSEECVIVTDKTSFYGESGGQVGDKGVMFIGDEKVAEVVNTKKTNDGKFLHFVKIEKGTFKVGDKVELQVYKNLRSATERNHSTTHLLQKALRNTLGTHVEQAGSYVTPERLRFDFTHIAAMTPDEIAKVEAEVNAAIMESLPVEIKECSYDEAVKMGAMALFGEKYGDVVRVVKMGDYSTELCGGTHLKNTANAGLFKIVSESGVAAGVRRIEGVTGLNVLNLIAEKDKIINAAASELKANAQNLPLKAAQAVEDNKSLQKEIDKLKAQMATGTLDELLKEAETVNGVTVLAAAVENMDMDTLRATGDKLKDRPEDTFALLISAKDGKINIIAVADKEVTKKGIHCGNIIREVAKLLGGGGGGKPESAQAGGKDASKIDEAVALAKELAKSALN